MPEPTLLILSGVQGDPRRYRTFHLYEQARLAGLDCQLSHVTDPRLRQKVTGANVIVLHRAAYDAQVSWIEKQIHRQAGLLIYDLDDLVFDPQAFQYIHSPDFADPVRRSLYREDIPRYRQALDLCDHVLVSSDYLAGRILELDKPVSVHRNAFSLEMQALADTAFTGRRDDPNRVVIGFASGTPTHDQDFAAIQPALQRILNRHPELELWLVGRLDLGGDWAASSPQVKLIDLVPWRILPGILASFDINLAPLQVDNPFGQSKSEIKYIEAGLLHVPTIASPSDAYQYAIQDGDNGFLCSSAQDWEACLEDLLQSSELRSEIGNNAHQHVLKNYHPLVRAQQLVDTLNSIAGKRFQFSFSPSETASPAGNQPPVFWSSAAFERTPTPLQRGLYSLKYRDLLTLLKQVWIFIRRAVSPIFPFQSSTQKDRS